MPWTHPFKPAENQRLDIALYQQAGQIIFITVRAYRYQSPFLNDELNQMVIDTLNVEQDRLGCSVFTYCLMPSHLHFLISPRQDGNSVLGFTDQFKGKTTNQSWKIGWHGKLWQPRSYDHIVRKDEDLQSIAEYILDNPVRKGLVSIAEEWRWSGHLTPLPIVA